MRKTFFTLILLAIAPASQASAESAKRPNVLFIIADDQSPFDFKAYDPSSPLDAPAIGRLASEGMTLDQAYHMGSMSGAVCSPSRTMVMSGRTLWHLPRRGKKHQKREEGLTKGEDILNNTIPAVFNRAGDDTMRTCKNGNSYNAANELFTVREDATKRGGTPETGSEWHGDRVIDYLNGREKAKDPNPFFIYFGFSHPHDVRDGTPELLKKYGAVNHQDKVLPSRQSEGSQATAQLVAQASLSPWSPGFCRRGLGQRGMGTARRAAPYGTRSGGSLPVPRTSIVRWPAYRRS